MRRQQKLAIFGFAFLVCCATNVFISPHAAIGQSDVVFLTAERGFDSRLFRFDLGTQTFAVDTGGFDSFQGATVLDDEVLVADYTSEAIQRFSADGTHLGSFANIVDPQYLESDASDNVYVTGGLAGPGSTFSRRYDSSGIFSQSFFHASLTAPRGIDADATGNVYITTTSSLFKFAANGAFINSISLGSSGHADLAIDEAGQRLFIANQFSSAGIRIFDISGAVPSFLGAILTPANSSIFGVHYAAESGNILATDLGLISNDPRGLEYSPLPHALLAEYRPVNGSLAWDIVSFAPIPEPASATLVLMAALGLVVARRGRA